MCACLRLVAIVSMLALSWTACGRGPEASSEIYRVRGVVRQLPAAGAPAAGAGAPELQVRHEAIPGFKNADGEVVGMDSMTMGFPLADTPLPSGLAAGDKIEMEFEVRWNGGHPLTITALEKLPPETRLDFEVDPVPAEGENVGGESSDAAPAVGERDAR